MSVSVMIPEEIWCIILRYLKYAELLEMRRVSYNMSFRVDQLASRERDKMCAARGEDGIWYREMMRRRETIHPLTQIHLIKVVESSCLRTDPNRANIGRMYKPCYQITQNDMTRSQARHSWKLFLDSLIWRHRVIKMVVDFRVHLLR